MNGWITIGTKMDTKDLQKELRQAEAQLRKFDTEAKRLTEQKTKLEMDNSDLQKIIDDYDTLQNKAHDYRRIVAQLEQQVYNMKMAGNTSGARLIEDGQLSRYQSKLQSVNSDLQRHEAQFIKAGNQIDKNNSKLSRIHSRIKQNESDQEELNRDIEHMNRELSKSQHLGNLKSNMDGMNNAMSGVLHKVMKWGLAIFSIRSVYSFIRNAVSTISQYNSQIGADVEYIRFALASTLQPVIEYVIGLVYRLLQMLAYVLKTLFGINIFANGSASAFKKAKESTGGTASNLKKAKKEAKEINKQLAGFDEMNVLQDNKDKDTGDTGGGGGGGAGGGYTPPKIDLGKMIDFSNFDLFEWIKEKLQKVRDWIYSIDWKDLGSKVYQKIKDFFTKQDWAGLFDSIFETIGAVWGAVGGFIVGFLKDAWKDIKDYFSTWIDKAHEMGGNVVDGILMGIANAIYQIGKWIWDHIYSPFINGFKKAFGISSPSKVMQEQGGYIIDGFKEGIKGIWNKVKDVFKTLKDKIIGVFKDTWTGAKKAFNGAQDFFQGIVNKITSKFKALGTKVGSAIGGAFKTAINKVLGAIENILNTPIRAINKLIGAVNKLPKVHMDKISTFSLPRLAKGGIVNLPGSGVPIGSAVAGERGKEGVIPLTDSQQMALLGEAIGKYITINANITNNMNGRVISRELQKIQNDNDFAYNR